MKSNTLPINKGDHLILYSTGLGGEFLTHAISQCVDNVNSLPVTYKDKDKNRYAVTCLVRYSEIALSTGLYTSQSYEGEASPEKINLLKDHYGESVFTLYKDFGLKNLNAILLTTSHPDHWAKVTWNKISLKVTNPSDVSQIRKYGYEDFPEEHLPTAIEILSQHKWLYRHELYAILTAILNNTFTKFVPHRRAKFLLEHTGVIKHQSSIKYTTDVGENFGNYITLNMDDTVNNIDKFIKDVKKVFPKLDKNKFAGLIKNWTKGNKIG